MNLTNRTKLSLTQFLDIFEKPQIKILFEKYSISSNCRNTEDIRKSVLTNDLRELIKEIVNTKQTLKKVLNQNIHLMKDGVILKNVYFWMDIKLKINQLFQ